MTARAPPRSRPRTPHRGPGQRFPCGAAHAARSAGLELHISCRSIRRGQEQHLSKALAAQQRCRGDRRQGDRRRWPLPRGLARGSGALRPLEHLPF